MPSTQIFPQSGGITLVSGNPFSGTQFPIGGVQLKLDKSAPGPVYVGLPLPNLTTSGAVTMFSGGSLSSGGFNDGMQMSPGDAYFVPKARLLFSGVGAIQIAAPAGSSGAVMFWEVQ